MKLPTITLYGFGYVGQALHEFLARRYVVHVVDPIRAGNGDTRCYFAPPVDTDYAVVCVPTAQRDDGTCDTSIVEQVVRAGHHRHYLVKSTVPPGTCERLGPHVVFSPEYVGEGKYAVPFWLGVPHPTDMSVHTFHIFGGTPAETALWANIWQVVAGWVPVYRQTTARTAELAKYAENMFLAAKKVFCSELYLAAQAFGVDYHTLRDLWLLDVRIGPSMTLVWPDELAYGGKCLPKDTRALVAALAALGHDGGLFRSVIERNDQLTRQDRPPSG